MDKQTDNKLSQAVEIIKQTEKYVHIARRDSCKTREQLERAGYNRLRKLLVGKTR